MANNIVSGGDARIKAPAGGTVTAGTFLKWSSNTLVAATDGAACAGVAVNSASTGEDVVAHVGDGQTIIRMTAASGYDPTVSAKLYIASSTTVDGGSSTNLCCGVCLTDASEAGTLEMVLWTPDSTGQYFVHA